MGQSTNAILFFGFCWSESTRAPWNIGKDYDDHDDEDDDDWEKRYARLKGFKEPKRPYPSREVLRTRENGYDSTPKDYSAEEKAIIEEHRASWAAKRELIEKLPVGVDTHCCGEEPMPYIFIKASQTITHRGDMNEITSLEVKPEWEPELRAFCEFMGVDVSSARAAWWMVVDWN